MIDIALLVFYLVRPKTVRNNIAFTNANNVEFFQQTSQPFITFVSSPRGCHIGANSQLCVPCTKEGFILMH